MVKGWENKTVLFQGPNLRNDRVLCIQSEFNGPNINIEDL